jgi:RHH-type proline utilization regulon transcriptional repressor/proline dehydrogenase/delta 1-pyrroline-5-carboxylate dehydrogenase
MIRLVKGAYWDSEIKRAQVEGLEGYPVYTRKVYTDVSYIACARKLLSVPEAIYPQFATHNAHTLSAIYHIAGQNYYPGQYEFQCLHGMGEPLYEQVVGKVAEGKLNRPCRVYAPVGTHETLLAYLVRRLLENGANTSFVNRIADQSISIRNWWPIRWPASSRWRRWKAASACRTRASRCRVTCTAASAPTRPASTWPTNTAWPRCPAPCWPPPTTLESRADARLRRQQASASPVLNPSDLRDVVGHVQEATVEDVDNAIQCALNAGPIWQATRPPSAPRFWNAPPT